MDEVNCIITAYALTGLLLASLCIATWQRARRTTARMAAQKPYES